MIIGLDEYAAHYQKVTQFEKNMIISTGIWEYFHNDGKSGWVKIQDERCLNTLYLDTRYYSAAALATLEDGKEVRVRYSVPDCRAYLDVYYAEFRYNLKGLQEFIPLFLFCVMVLILKPDFLYLGLIDLSDTPDPAEKP